MIKSIKKILINSFNFRINSKSTEVKLKAEVVQWLDNPLEGGTIASEEEYKRMKRNGK